MSRRTGTVAGIRYGWVAGQTYLQQQHENRSSEMMNQQSTWPCTTKVSDVIFYPMAPSTGRKEDLPFRHTKNCVLSKMWRGRKYLVAWFQLQCLPQSLNGFCVFTLQGQYLEWNTQLKVNKTIYWRLIRKEVKKHEQHVPCPCGKVLLCSLAGVQELRHKT